MDSQNAVLVVIDVQGKWAMRMYDHEHCFANIERVIKIAQIFEMPILWTEQAPEKIGYTIPPIADLLSPKSKPIVKRTFSCYGCPEFKEAIDRTRRQQVILVGIETHVCIYQSARDLNRHGYDVRLVADAVSSGTQANRDTAIARMRSEGIVITSAEMLACELLVSADHPKFKDVLANIKR